MSQVRYLFDHDVDGPIISGVRRREPAMVAVRLQDVMPRETRDPDVLADAADQGYIPGDGRREVDDRLLVVGERGGGVGRVVDLPI